MPFQIVRNDITQMHVDAIVNTANPKPGYGAGIDCAVYEAAVTRVRQCNVADMAMTFTGGAWKADIDRDFENRGQKNGRGTK